MRKYLGFIGHGLTQCMRLKVAHLGFLCLILPFFWRTQEVFSHHFSALLAFGIIGLVLLYHQRNPKGYRIAMQMVSDTTMDSLSIKAYTPFSWDDADNNGSPRFEQLSHRFSMPSKDPERDSSPLSELEKRLEAENRELKLQLLTEQKFNDMMLTFLRAEHSKGDGHEPDLLSLFSRFFTTDFCAIYSLDNFKDTYKLYKSASSQSVRNKTIESLRSFNLEKFEWSATKVLQGKISIFQKTMLDRLLHLSSTADPDTRKWLENKINQTLEYSVCRDNNWSYLIAIPCIYDDEVQSIVIMGLQTSELPKMILNEGRMLSACSFLTRGLHINRNPLLLPEENKEQIKAYKLEAVSALSAGLAHDFNNILTAILANISLAREELPANSELSQFLQAAEESTLRGKVLTDHLMTFANPNNKAKTESETALMLKSFVDSVVCNSEVTVKYEIDPNLPKLQIKADAFEKVVQNIVHNALQAMKPEGVLRITSKLTENMLTISFADNGSGIESKDLGSVFNPYWTTRTGRSGLGLTIVYSILKKNGGSIDIASQSGIGTEVKISLPTEASFDIETPKSEDNKVRNTLLVMEDNSFKKILMETLLKKHFVVLETSDPDSIMARFDEARMQGNPLTDVIIDFDFYEWDRIKPHTDRLLSSIPSPELVAFKTNIAPEDIRFFKKAGFSNIFGKPFHSAELTNLLNNYLSK